MTSFATQIRLATWLCLGLGSVASVDAGEVPVKFFTEFCSDCHNAETKAAGLDLQSLRDKPVGQHAAVWEKVVRRLETRQMPPRELPRPNEEAYDTAVHSLTKILDAGYQNQPRPGRTQTFRRLTRAEYQNAIRDLLALKIDAKSLLPADESSHGFDNITVGDLSPTLLNRYISAAQKISKRAIGGSGGAATGKTYRIRPDVTQEDHIPGLPLGTRGGTILAHNFPQSGEYEIQVRLARDRNEEVEGLSESHEMEVLLDRKLIKSFTVKPPKGPDHSQVDRHLKTRFKAEAGPRNVGVTFLKKPSSLLVTKRQPYEAHFNKHRHPRISPAVYQVSITGPFSPTGPGNTSSRKRVLFAMPNSAEEEDSCATRILTRLVRRAYRRPVTSHDLQKAMAFYQQGRAEHDFETGIELALSSVLVNPNFLFRIEHDPPDLTETFYQISNWDLASRLSFFLWSSIPDEELLDLAQAGKLQQPKILEQQVRRMLADPRAKSLTENFADQWLHLRNLDSFTPDLRLFPDFDDNLRQAFRQETEMFFASIVREDRNIMDFLKADYTFLNERLAKHYGIPHIYGNRFRRVALPENSQRGGLLRQGSVLCVTSYATRTSPVIRGHWILRNILGSPPPPPPPPPANVPALKDNTVNVNLTVRERLAQHRANPNCAGCHDLMDPVGLALENFDAVGRWRDVEADQPIDAQGGLADGSTFTGVRGLEEALRKRQDLFATTLTEKLLSFALGRVIDERDAPAIRKIVRDAKAENYRFSALVLGITRSVPFQMRETE